MNSPLRVLHLEDNAADTELIQATLEAEGVQAKLTRVEAEDDFIRALKDERFDLILADYTLPSFDGLSALRIAQQRASDIPFIFVSGTLGEDIAIEALKTGATDYILKTRLARLGPAVQRALREAREKAGRRSAEVALRESVSRYRYIFDAAGVSIWEEDFSQVKAAIDELKAQGILDFRQYTAEHPEFVRQAMSMIKVIDVNDATVKLYGAQNKEQLLLSLDRVLGLIPAFDPEIEEVMRGQLIAIAEGQTSFESEKVAQTLNGDKLTIMFTITFPPEPSKFDRVLVSIMDITERKRVEDALRESEARLAEAQRIAHVGYWERDLETDLLTWSDESYRIFGLKPQEGTVDLAGWQELIHPEDRQMIAGEAAELVAGRARYDVEYRVVRPSGEVRIVHSQGDVVRNEAGRPRRVFGTIQDITDRKQAEEALQKTQAELAHVARLTTMGELTSSIAHEVNQPLTAIVTSGNACLRWLSNDPPDVDEARELVSRIVKDGHRASDVVRRIRGFFKKIAPEKVRLEINQLIKDVIAMVPGELSRNRVQLRTELTVDLPPVIGDPIQLQQVLLNLVINSIEAMSKVDGPRELLIKSQQYESDSVLVAVQDNGAGFDEQNADQLFEAFYTTKSNGLGLGLSISRTTIEAYGGRLWATTNNGDGATFQFTLPAK
jgi:PAS domain S-box-containing protein